MLIFFQIGTTPLVQIYICNLPINLCAGTKRYGLYLKLPLFWLAYQQNDERFFLHYTFQTHAIIERGNNKVYRLSLSGQHRNEF